MSIIRLIGTFALPGFFLYKYLNINYPSETRLFIQKSLWFALKVETQLSISFNQTRNYLNDYTFDPLYNLMYPITEEQCITFVKNGKEIDTTTYSQCILTNEFPEYDFVLYNVNNILTRFNNVNKIKEMDTTIEYVPPISSVRFLSAKISDFFFRKTLFLRTFLVVISLG